MSSHHLPCVPVSVSKFLLFIRSPAYSIRAHPNDHIKLSDLCKDPVSQQGYTRNYWSSELSPISSRRHSSTQTTLLPNIPTTYSLISLLITFSVKPSPTPHHNSTSPCTVVITYPTLTWFMFLPWFLKPSYLLFIFLNNLVFIYLP